MKNIFTLLVLFGCIPLLQAHTPVKAGKQVVKELAVSSTVKKDPLPVITEREEPLWG